MTAPDDTARVARRLMDDWGAPLSMRAQMESAIAIALQSERDRATSEIADLRRELEEARRERDEARDKERFVDVMTGPDPVKVWREQAFELAGKLDAAETRATALEVQLTQAREALRPFAQADLALGDDAGPYRLQTLTGYREITRDDLRRARATLATMETPDETC